MWNPDEESKKERLRNFRESELYKKETLEERIAIMEADGLSALRQEGTVPAELSPLQEPLGTDSPIPGKPDIPEVAKKYLEKLKGVK